MSLKIVQISDGFSSSAVPSTSPPTSSASFTYIITNTDLVTKSIPLPTTPSSPTSAKLTWLGVQQYFGPDFDIVGAAISWNGLGLDGLIELGDIVEVYYQ
jgi:hypothetical protein